MDKRAKRLIADIQKSLSANPSKIPTKTIEKLIGKANGTEKLHHLLVSTKYALENGQAESALMLAAVSLTSYPENEDCRTTFGSILDTVFEAITICIWSNERGSHVLRDSTPCQA